MSARELIITGAVMAVLSAAVLACAPARRVTRALAVFGKGHMPRWAWLAIGPALGVCALIPGPVDELLALGVIAVPVLRSRAARAELATAVRDAWQGPAAKSPQHAGKHAGWRPWRRSVGVHTA